jgi:hypothetical protein
MTRKYLAFDLETAKVTSGRNWLSDRPLGICCAATWMQGQCEPVLWHGRTLQGHYASRMAVAEVRTLVKYLEGKLAEGWTIVTWNGTSFDFDILAEESKMRARCKALALTHVDMMFHLICSLGVGVSLNAAARGMRLMKTEKRLGPLIPNLWASGRHAAVLRHVSRDARVTLSLAISCCERGFVRWITRWGTGRMLRLPNGWMNVVAAHECAHQLSSSRGGRWTPDELTAWIRS